MGNRALETTFRGLVMLAILFDIDELQAWKCLVALKHLNEEHYFITSDFNSITAADLELGNGQTFFFVPHI